MTRFPNLFIIGAPKSGTTSLYHYLSGHPEIYMSDVKEPGYFARDLTAETPDNTMRYGDDEAAYLALFAAAGDVRYAGEASVRYLYSHDAPTLIHAVQPDARILVMLRNPIETAHSLHTHMVAGGAEDIAEFEQALAAEPDRHAGRRLPPTANPRLATYRDRASYGEQLPRWFKTFGRDHVHVSVFEEFVSQPAAGFRAVLEFLEVDPDYQPASFAAYNVAHGARSTRVRALLSARAPQWLVWRLMPRLIGDRRTRALVQRFRQSRLHRRPIEKAPISPELREHLELEFGPDVARLSELLGRDMGKLWFGRPAQPAGVEVGARVAS